MQTSRHPRLHRHHPRRPDGPFQAEWDARRRTYLDVQPKPSLQARNLAFADLSGAFFPGLDLRDARLEGANLGAARLEGADLSGARLEGANLRRSATAGGGEPHRARLEGADLSDAGLEGADLSMRGWRGRTSAGAAGGGGPPAGAAGGGEPRALARLEGADLSYARLEGADLSFARLEGADLERGAAGGGEPQLHILDWIGGSADAVKSTNLSAVVNNGGALRFVDLREAISDAASDFHNAFGDATVILPDGIEPPCHWSRDELDDMAFHGRWRWWIERGQEVPWSYVAPDGYENVPVNPPPPEQADCAWR